MNHTFGVYTTDKIKCNMQTIFNFVQDRIDTKMCKINKLMQ